MNQNQPKIALVYDRVNKFGGAERVLQALNQIWPQAPIYTSVYNPKTAPWAKKFNVRPSFLQKFPWAKSNHEHYLPLMPRAFESLDLAEFDIILSVTSAEAKGVITKPHQLHICYMLTPTRYLWSHTHDYVKQSRSSIGRSLRHTYFSHLRRWDFLAGQRPDKIIAISQHVARRVNKYYRRQTDAVIYPPVEVSKFTRSDIKTDNPQKHFLMVSRLVDYKSIDIVLNAFSTMPGQQLKIIGDGRSRQYLQNQATENVQFLGFVPDNQLVKEYQSAQALIFPQEEDFGIVAVEAQAAGIPVIARNQGGAKETIIHNQTGILLDQLTPARLCEAVREVSQKNWYSNQIIDQAHKFDQSVFVDLIKKFVEESWQLHLEKQK